VANAYAGLRKGQRNSRPTVRRLTQTRCRRWRR